MTTVLIADDQALVRVGLRKILDAEPETNVVGEASDGEDAVSEARRLRPDVVLMDIRMPVLDGIEATRRIVDDAAEHTRADPDDVRARHLRLRRAARRRQRLHAQRRAAGGDRRRRPDRRPRRRAPRTRGHARGDRGVRAATARRPASPTAALLDELTPREQEVLDLLARGLSNPEICQQLVISEATAKTHVARILQKLDLRDRVQAVIYAYETGLVAPGSPR